MDAAIGIITLGVIAIVIGVVLLVRRNNAERDNLVETPNPDIHESPSVPLRHFSLDELKRQEFGRYRWDDSGLVFEVNSDGSVTMVGHFDPIELFNYPQNERMTLIENRELEEMLPFCWCFLSMESEGNRLPEFFFSAFDNLYSTCEVNCQDVNEIYSINFKDLPVENSNSPLLKALEQPRRGTVILMPTNEDEFILSLGAQACIKRLFKKRVRVKISSPAVMGALYAGVLSMSNNVLISFACEHRGNYQCCNMLLDDGIYEVKSIVDKSVIRPHDVAISNDFIARGSLIQLLAFEGKLKDIMTLDMLPYPVSLRIFEEDRQVHAINVVSEPELIPFSKKEIDIFASPRTSVALYIGRKKICDDILSEVSAPRGPLKVCLEVDAGMSMKFYISTNEKIHLLNIGNLIG